MSEIAISDELREDDLERGCIETAVSFIGDFNYSILDRIQLEDLEGLQDFRNYIQPKINSSDDEKLLVNLWKHSLKYYLKSLLKIFLNLPLHNCTIVD